MKKLKVIIDTDPGVDDAQALIYAFFEKKLDIKLITTARGNVAIDIATRNICHLLDLFDKDIPVAKGAEKAMERESADASFLHSVDGLGGYKPPKTTKHKPIKENAIDAMYHVIKENAGEIDVLLLGPQTNLGILLRQHPDVKYMIRRVIAEGPSPFGALEMPDHVSFNARTDPEAFKLVLDSGIPLVIIPSTIGRNHSHFEEEQVYDLVNHGDVGKFLYKMFVPVYWEPNFPDKRISSNDTNVIIFCTNPRIYEVLPTNIELDLIDRPGKMVADFDKHGKTKIVISASRKKFQKLFYKRLKELEKIKLKTNL